MARRNARRSPRRREAAVAPDPAPDYHKENIRRRLWRTLDYLTIPVSSGIIFGITAQIENFLYRMVWSFLRPTLQTNETIALVGDLFQIGVAIVSVVAFVIHASFSLYATYQIEKQFAHNGS